MGMIQLTVWMDPRHKIELANHIEGSITRKITCDHCGHSKRVICARARDWLRSEARRIGTDPARTVEIRDRDGRISLWVDDVSIRASLQPEAADQAGNCSPGAEPGELQPAGSGEMGFKALLEGSHGAPSL
jgi:hypothetical protein